jgi:hypothetical protein
MRRPLRERWIGKNPERDGTVESHPFGFARGFGKKQGRLLRTERARMGHPRFSCSSEKIKGKGKIKSRVKGKVKIKIKGSGQECPLHTA